MRFGITGIDDEHSSTLRGCVKRQSCGDAALPHATFPGDKQELKLADPVKERRIRVFLICLLVVFQSDLGMPPRGSSFFGTAGAYHDVTHDPPAVKNCD